MSKERYRRPAVSHPATLRGSGEKSAGFSLVEALVATFILTLVALSLAQLIGIGMLSNKTALDLTQATSLSGAKLEQLRSGDYSSLVAGGSLVTSNVGYFDLVDADGDGNSDYVRRWSITDQPGGKLIQVQVTSNTAAIGPAKSATMATVVASR